MSSRPEPQLLTVAHDGTIPPAPKTEGTLTDPITDLQGIQFVNPGHPYFFQTTLAYAAATTAAAPIISSPTTTHAIWITDILFTANTSAAFTLLNRVTATAVTIGVARVAPGGGSVSHSFRNPLKASAVDTTTAAPNLGLTTDATVTTAILTGFYAP